MKINTTAFVASIVMTTTLLWIICSLFVAIFPDLSAAITGQMLHMDSEQIDFQLHWSGFFLGLLNWIVSAVLAGWLFSLFFNRLDLSEKE